MTEGRNTGIPTIQRELTRNGSPAATFETDEDRPSFLVRIPCHEGEEGVPSAFMSPESKNKETNNYDKENDKKTPNYPVNTYYDCVNGVNVGVNSEDVGVNVGVNSEDVGVNVGVNSEDVGVNVGVTNDNVGANVGVKLTDAQKKIYSMIIANPNITHSTMAKALSITPKTAERATKALRNFGLLRREGSDKTGKWIIVTSSK